MVTLGAADGLVTTAGAACRFAATPSAWAVTTDGAADVAIASGSCEGLGVGSVV